MAKIESVEGVAAPKRMVSPTPRASSLMAETPGVLPPRHWVELPIVFEREEGSPFPDGYSLTKERVVLRELLEADDPDSNSPLWPRYELYEERLAQYERMKTDYRLKVGAGPEVPYSEARKLKELGGLVDEGVDTMSIHTKEGFRMFLGRGRDPEGQVKAIPGGKRMASSLKALWLLSSQDNPYADWALLRAATCIEEIQAELEQKISTYTEQLDVLKKRGLSVHVLKSSEPKEVELTFKSPYGYLIAELVIQFDYYVRVVKTMIRKGRFTDAAGRDVIRTTTRRIRAFFEEIARFDRYLLRPELKGLCRADFLPGADAESAKRVKAATGIFGPVPEAIFTGKMVPPYSQRRAAPMSPAERELLERVAHDLIAQDAAAEAGGEAAGQALV
ncbi:TIGR03761 family integrating conjugative element protein [Niveibacterium sp. 24ML]|uniref:PFL_4669 family integrating conjugative element protein n=1 Tax=Niveibacterium sp. 24ML TaxID=2985512 RepID=UPI00226F881C|nr:TIGR03761 family integrating conjugative element protein [Niveibacterium sp. 24ML]MCX9158106.1 TIGR03761 family integrating conjugative element protein [Niveibacterium sp. 24ML]